MIPSYDWERGRHWWPAPAKLNLFLHVTGRCPDGRHQLQTLFQLLDWGDAVFVQATDDGRITRRGADYPVAENTDLAIRAARHLRSATGARQGAVIEVKKEIPIGAGLGGGSSDAATVLHALNLVWACGVATADLARIGLELGADVPVFVHGHSALATGVGEILDPVLLGPRHYLLVMPHLAVSTAEVFSDPELRRDTLPITSGEALAGGGRNDCEAVVRLRHPQLAKLIDALGEFGDARMSGTGSAVFVPMASRAAAADAATDATKMLESGAARNFNCRYNVRAVSGLDRSPLVQALTMRTPG